MISVVIPAFNEEKRIGTTLASLTQQKTKKDFEVIVVDNNSYDNTYQIASSFKDKLNLKVILEKKKGRGIARYTGFEKAVGDIILSTDADAKVPPHWIDSLSQEFSNKKTIAVTGPCYIKDCSPWTNFVFNHFWQFLCDGLYRLQHGHWCLMGFNFAIRKDAYIKAGKFDKRLNCFEDSDLSARVAKVGHIKRSKTAVEYSGRRFQKSFFMGNIHYLVNYIKTPIVGKENLILEDIR